MKWYDGNQTLTHNCLFNFVIGPRGVGKTYWSKMWQVKRFLKTGEQFVYVRRYKEELRTLGSYFNAIKDNFPEVAFEVNGTNLYINGEHAGTAIALSTSLILKSSEFPKVTSIVFDEFIIEKGTYRYLPKEVNKFLDLYETISRLRENVIAFFMANAITMTNPYFLYFDIKVPYGSTFFKRGDVLFQYVNNEEYQQAKASSRFGQIIQGTEYAEYSINNQFLLDNSTFIEKKPGKADFLFSMTYNGYKMGIWVDYDAGLMWASWDVAHDRINFAMTLADHTENTLMIKSLSKSRFYALFLDAYKTGHVRFEDMTIKNLIYEIIKTTIR